jgi:hypothetical protein
MQKNVIILWADASTYDNKKKYHKILTWLWSKISTLQQQNRELPGEERICSCAQWTKEDLKHCEQFLRCCSVSYSLCWFLIMKDGQFHLHLIT